MNASVASRPPQHRLSLAGLQARWLELADDPLVCAIPFKVELDDVAEDGTVEMLDANGRIDSSSFGIALAPPR
jgi:hypothetical protein